MNEVSLSELPAFKGEDMGLFTRSKKLDNIQPIKLSKEELLLKINELSRNASLVITDTIDGQITDDNIDYFNQIKSNYENKTDIELFELIECFWGGSVLGYSYAENDIKSMEDPQKAELLNKLYPTYINLNSCHETCLHKKINFYPTDIQLIDRMYDHCKKRYPDKTEEQLIELIEWYCEGILSSFGRVMDIIKEEY
ncbi:MAG: hypothetical protein ACPK85_03045 [Methanosarcina sp.]